MTSRFVFHGPDGRTLSPDEVAAKLRDLIGHQMPGGCDDCTATHEYREDTPDIIDIFIHHDPTCPQLVPVRGDV